MIKDALLEDDDEESIETDCEQTKDNRSKDWWNLWPDC
jgi:hypothetical protein